MGEISHYLFYSWQGAVQEFKNYLLPAGVDVETNKVIERYFSSSILNLCYYFLQIKLMFFIIIITWVYLLFKVDSQFCNDFFVLKQVGVKYTSPAMQLPGTIISFIYRWLK